MADNISVFDINSLLIAFAEMEGRPDYPNYQQCPWGTGGSSVHQAISAFHSEEAEAEDLTAEEQRWRVEDNKVVGEAIYGRGGHSRYFLRADGYVYFSEYHVPGGDYGKNLIEKAKSLGFRIN